MAKKLTDDVKEAVAADAKDFVGKTPEEIKAEIERCETQAKENVRLNNESIKSYRARAQEARELREKSRILRGLLKTEKTEKTVEAAISFMTEDQLKDLIGKAQEKLQK